MEHEVAMKWVAALRSGDYGQCRGSLRTREGDNLGNEFCCLGVLCDVFAKEHPEAHWVSDEETIRKGRIRNPCINAAMFVPGSKEIGTPAIGDTYEATSSLPTQVCSWSGLRDRNGMFFLDEAEFDPQELKETVQMHLGESNVCLTALNDFEKWSFSEIADFIETNYKIL